MASHDGLLARLSLPLSLQALLVQIGAWTLAIPLSLALGWLVAPLSLAGLTLLQGGVAWALSRVLAMPGWWQLINLGFFPLAGLALQLEIASGWYLAALLLLFLVQWGALKTRVPLYLSSGAAKQAMVEAIDLPKGARLLDLGSGTGSLLAHLAHARPDLSLHGVEAAPLPWLLSRLRLGQRAELRMADMWSEDLSRYDVVYAFLSPAPMARLWAKVQREMRPGSLFISNSFDVPGVAPDEVIELDDLTRARLLVWHKR